MRPVSIGAISFINTLPIYHLFQPNELESLVYASPASLNQFVAAGKLEISPVSSAHYLRHQRQLLLVPGLSVSSPGAVESVLFVSKNPMNHTLLDLPAIMVPDDSETSIALLAHLLQQSVKVDFRPWFKSYVAGDYAAALESSGNALIIGDHALMMADVLPEEGYYCYDLADLWFRQTGLPFVFAVWVAQKDWAQTNAETLQQVTQRLCESREAFFADGTHLEEAVRLAEDRCKISPATLRRYFTRSLDFGWTQAHQSSLTLFSQVIQQLDTLSNGSERDSYTFSRTSSAIPF
ncbi:MAG: menaquinone biosynthesis protein [Vampirovibrio sp.]|nr:menaquinone biosynthesis protein [Vampirovibrio sp.]